MSITKFLSFVFFCIFTACGNFVSQNENVNQAQIEEKTKLFLRMERSHCYGTCPVYELTVQPDGKVLFNGIDFTETEGKVESNLSEGKMKQLIAEIERVNFFSLKDDYTLDSGNCPSDATDSPTVILDITLNSKEKIIKHYLGCWNEGNPNDGTDSRIFPQPLYKLENKIDAIVETKRWVGEEK